MYGNMDAFYVAQLEHFDMHDVAAALRRQGETVLGVRDCELFDVYNNSDGVVEAEFFIDVKDFPQSKFKRYFVSVCLEEGRWIGYLDWSFEEREREEEKLNRLYAAKQQ